MAPQVEGIFVPMLQIQVCLSCIRQGYVSLRHQDRILSCGGCQRIIHRESKEEESLGSFIVPDIRLFCERSMRQGVAEELGSHFLLLLSTFSVFYIETLHKGFLKTKKASS